MHTSVEPFGRFAPLDRRVDCAVKVCLWNVIYILNVVVKQEILIKTRENKTGDTLSCYRQQSFIRYKNIEVVTYTQHWQFEKYLQQEAQLSQRDRAAPCLNISAKSVHVTVLYVTALTSTNHHFTVLRRRGATGRAQGGFSPPPVGERLPPVGEFWYFSSGMTIGHMTMFHSI